MNAFYLILFFCCNVSITASDTARELESYAEQSAIAGLHSTFDNMGGKLSKKYADAFHEEFPDHSANKQWEWLQKAGELFQGSPKLLSYDVKISIAKLLQALPENSWNDLRDHVIQRPKLIRSEYFENLLVARQNTSNIKDFFSIMRRSEGSVFFDFTQK